MVTGMTDPYNRQMLTDSLLKSTDTERLDHPMSESRAGRNVELRHRNFQSLDVARSMEINRTMFDQFRLTDVASDSTATTNKRLLIIQKQLFNQALNLQALLTFN